LNDLLGDWLEIIWECSSRLPLHIRKVVRDQATAPSAIEVRVYMAQVYPQLGLAVLNVRGDIFDEISEMLVRILKVAEEHGPANWIVGAINHDPVA